MRIKCLECFFPLCEWIKVDFFFWWVFFYQPFNKIFIKFCWFVSITYIKMILNGLAYHLVFFLCVCGWCCWFLLRCFRFIPCVCYLLSDDFIYSCFIFHIEHRIFSVFFLFLAVPVGIVRKQCNSILIYISSNSCQSNNSPKWI